MCFVWVEGNAPARGGGGEMPQMGRGGSHGNMQAHSQAKIPEDEKSLAMKSSRQGNNDTRSHTLSTEGAKRSARGCNGTHRGCDCTQCAQPGYRPGDIMSQEEAKKEPWSYGDEIQEDYNMA